MRLGRGKLRRTRRKGRWVYLADWRDSAGRRHREVLSEDRATAQRILDEKIRQRDLELEGVQTGRGRGPAPVGPC